MLYSFNIVDVIIILGMLSVGIVGLKRGVILQTVMSIGTIIAYVLAFYLKGPLAHFLNMNFPYWTFTGAFKGVTILNVMLYHILAFVVILVIILVILNIIIAIAGGFEKILKFTIVLGIPSKILGFILGLVEGYILVYMALFLIHQPAMNFDFVQKSKLTPIILNSTPVLSNVAQKVNNAISDIYALKDVDKENLNNYNLEVLDIMLKYKITTKKEILDIKNKGKLDTIQNIDSILEKY
jgi:uncharacterized membrane protein required for colicin V production